jgi:hypothetical protein
MTQDINTITINETEYVAKDSIQNKVSGDYVIVRTVAAGVFAGVLVKKDSNEVTLHNARRLWYWDGAASLSQLAMEGVTKPENCKFPCEVEKIILIGVIEIIFCTIKAIKSIQGVKIWKQ